MDTSILVPNRNTQITKFIEPTWGPPWSCRPQMGPMFAPWTLLLRYPAQLGPMGQWPCHCTSTTQYGSIELEMERISPTVVELWTCEDYSLVFLTLLTLLQMCPLKFHTKFRTHTLQNMHFTRCKNFNDLWYLRIMTLWNVGDNALWCP